jgi:hypothetical protein
MTDPNLCFDAWTIRKVPNDDFGQDHWDYDDETDYQNVDNSDDNDDDYNRAIEHFEENDVGMNFDADAGGGFVGDSWNRGDNFGYNDRRDYDQQQNRSDGFGLNDRGGYGQQGNRDDNSGYNDSGDYGQQGNRDDDSSYNNS